MTYDAGTANPLNPCQSCDPAQSATAWSNRVSGFPCTSDNLPCTDEVCDGLGACRHSLFTGCLIAGACVGSDSLDPTADCRACRPLASTPAYSNKLAGLSCADDGVSTTLDVCVRSFSPRVT